MHTHRFVARRRKAIGSIVGTAFFVLILLSGYFFYTLMNQGDAAQQKVFSDMKNFDIERAQEAITLINPVQVDGADLTVTLKNTGSRSINITRVGFWDGAQSAWDYAPTVTILPDGVTLITATEQGTGVHGLRVETGATCELRITTNGIEPGRTYLVQFLTENGLLFTVSYP